MALSRATVNPTDPLLTQFIVEFMQDNTLFIADKIFPIINVIAEKGTYYTSSSSKDMFTLPDVTERAPGGAYGRGDLSIGTSTFTCEEDGWEEPIDDRLRDTTEKPYDVARWAAEKAANVVMLRREKKVLDAINNATTFASYTEALAGNDRWDDDNSEPIDKVDSWSETIRGNCGLWPNTIILAWDVWLALKEHPVIIDRIKTTNDKIVTPDLVARLFNVERLLLSQAAYNSAEEGQTVSLADMMSKKVFLGYIAKSPNLTRPSVGYTIQKEGLTAEKYREDRIRGDVARVRVNEVHKIVAAECGYYGTTIIS